MTAAAPETLDSRRRRLGITVAGLARELGAHHPAGALDRGTVWRWCLGPGEEGRRVPRHEADYAAIFLWSGGSVRPDSFYPIGTWQALLRAENGPAGIDHDTGADAAAAPADPGAAP